MPHSNVKWEKETKDLVERDFLEQLVEVQPPGKAFDNVKMLTFQEYQQKARDFAIYRKEGKPYAYTSVVYPTLGLCGESGEVAEKVKKIIRDKDGVWTDEDIRDISLELGDVLWYITNLAFDLGVSLEDVALRNLAKLEDRQKRGKIGGSGDDR